MDYRDTLLVAKLTSVRIIVSLTATHHWPLYQLDVKNTFFNSVLTRRFTWSNHPVLLLRGSKARCVGWRSPCMDWSSHQELDLDDLSLLFELLAFFVLRRIILCFIYNIKRRSYSF